MISTKSVFDMLDTRLRFTKPITHNSIINLLAVLKPDPVYLFF